MGAATSWLKLLTKGMIKGGNERIEITPEGRKAVEEAMKAWGLLLK